MTDGTQLARLAEEGRRLVTDEFLRGRIDRIEGIDEFVEPLPGEQRAALDKLGVRISEVRDEYDPADTAMDRALAVDIRESIQVTRRVAADPGLWHWLAVVKFPEFVRHRWEYTTETAMREKFLGAGTDLYSNALHRLWWIAELTRQNADERSGYNYDLTRRVFENQTVINKVFDRWFARYKPVVVPLCDALAPELGSGQGPPSRVVEEVTNRFNHTLTTIQLEGLEQAEAEALIEEIVAEASKDSPSSTVKTR